MECQSKDDFPSSLLPVDSFKQNKYKFTGKNCQTHFVCSWTTILTNVKLTIISLWMLRVLTVWFQPQLSSAVTPWCRSLRFSALTSCLPLHHSPLMSSTDFSSNYLVVLSCSCNIRNKHLHYHKCLFYKHLSIWFCRNVKITAEFCSYSAVWYYWAKTLELYTSSQSGISLCITPSTNALIT